MSDAVIIEVRANEHMMRTAAPRVPWSPAEIADDAVRCADAGASVFHFHAREPRTGAGSTSYDLYEETMSLIRDRSDIVVVPTLGTTALSDPAERIAHIVKLAASPHTRPDMASLDLGSFNIDPFDAVAGDFEADDVVYQNPVRTIRFLSAAMRTAGVRPAAALWTIGSARLLGALVRTGDIPEPVYANITLSTSYLSQNPATNRGLRAITEFLPRDVTCAWSAIALGTSILPIVGTALEEGGNVATGLGDHPYGELGTPTNADVVVEIGRLLRSFGRRPATIDETRAMTGLS